MKQFFTIIILVLANTLVFSQMNYTVSFPSATYTAVTGTNPTLSLAYPLTSAAIDGISETDEGAANGIILPFPFKFNGIRTYNTCNISTNGFVTFGSSILDTLNGYWLDSLSFGPVYSLSEGGVPPHFICPNSRPIIAPLWDDLDLQSTSNLTVNTSGIVGSRIFTIQWSNVKWNWLAFSANINFQVKLFEADNSIMFHYKQSPGNLKNASASIGLADSLPGTGHFLSMSGVTNAATSSSSVENHISVKPADNFAIKFTPIPCPATSSVTNATICSSALPYNWNGLTFSTAGSQIAYLTNKCGNDSAATLNLSVKTNYTINASASANGSISSSGATTVCSGNNQAYTITANNGYYTNDVLVDGVSQGAITTYTFNNVTANHTISASFTLICQTTTSTTNTSICPSQLPYTWNGKTLTDAGTLIDTLTNAAGCDSIATLNLTVKATSTSTTNISICPNALPYSWNGLTFNSAGSQTKHLTNAAGCDSAATLNLSINAQPTPAANSVCVGSTLQLTNATNGGVWSSVAGRATVSSNGLVTGTSAGVATIIYKANGATSTYYVTVNALPQVPTVAYAAGYANPKYGAPTDGFCKNKTFGIIGMPSGGVFTSSNNSILTINCSGVVNTVGLGAGSLTYTYTNNYGCSNSRTLNGNVVNCAARGVATNDKPATTNEFSMYPNPAHSLISLNVNSLIGAGSIVITDLYGKQVKTQPLSLGTNTIDIANLSKGIYFVSTITNDGKTTKKLVVE